MTIFKRMVKPYSPCWLMFSAALLAGSAHAWAYDAELDAGARFASDSPSALGAFSWNASTFYGEFAAGATAEGEVSVDAEGQPGIDAALTGNFSRSRGRFVSGLRLEAAALHSPDSWVGGAVDSVDLTLSAPFTLNGADLSLSVVPLVGSAFFDDESVDYGADVNLAYLAGDFVLKPGAAILRTHFSDGSRTLEIAPSLGFVWYPGIPVSADFSVAWSRTSYEEGGASTSYPVSAAVSAVPVPWLCLTLSYESEGDAVDPREYRVEGEIEFCRYGSRGTALHFPVAAYYSRSDEKGEEFGASVMVGYSFGGE